IASSTPVVVSGAASVVAISAGGGHSCALMSGGTAECWGRNTYGELGNGALLHWRIVAVAGECGGMFRSHPGPVRAVSSSAFAGFRFPPEIIVLAVRWYLRYGLSYRHVEQLLAERGIE